MPSILNRYIIIHEEHFMQAHYQIQGMHCKACIDKIKAVLQPLATKLEISLQPPRLSLESAQAISLEQLNAAISAAGDYKLLLLAEERA